MSTDANDWTATDLRAAEENLRQTHAEVERLRAKLADAEAAKDAHGVGPEPTGAEAGRAEARRRLAERSGKATRSTSTTAADKADQAPRDATWADGVAEAQRRAAERRTSAA
ncbi:hypothetical protein [Geodermatophilus chilensis]|uniref:hypothetical protein n=1 Tax=Geodermatophilus chilensis TaxID=2035835 RepID=UPI000C269095|nr:hypothetical protein [Geodermatophilus chilensis]